MLVAVVDGDRRRASGLAAPDGQESCAAHSASRRLIRCRKMSVAAGSIAAVDIAADIAVGDIAAGNTAVGNTVDVIGPAAARRAALAAQGFADARPAGPAHPSPPRAAAGPDPAAAARLGERRGPRALHAGVQPARALRPGRWWTTPPGRTRRAVPGCWSSTGRTRPACCRSRTGRCCCRAPSARAGGGTTRRSPTVSRGLVDELLAAVKELGPVGAGTLEAALGGRARPRPQGRHVVGAVGHQADLRVPVRHRRAHHRGAGALPAALRPARAGAAARGPGAHPADPEASARGAGAPRGRRPRCRDGAGPARLLPPRARAVPAGRRRTGRGRRAGAGRRAWLAPSGVPAARHADRRGASRRVRCCRRSTR